MPSFKLWEGLSLNWGDKATFEEYAAEAVPVLEKQMIRNFVIALLLFVAGLVALYYESMVLGAALLLLAVHCNDQSNKSHLLLVLTAYQRVIARMLEGAATSTRNAE